MAASGFPPYPSLPISTLPRIYPQSKTPLLPSPTPSTTSSSRHVNPSLYSSSPPPTHRHPPQSDSPAALAFALDHFSAALSLAEGSQIHARVLRLGLSSDPDLSARLLRLYAACGRPDAARAILDSTPPHLLTPFAYNSLIRAYTSSSLHELALLLFLKMLASGLRPNEFTFPFVLKSSALLGFLDLGRQLHAMLLKAGLFLANVFCASALLDLYVKLAPLGEACRMFDRIPHRNAVTWNSMISAYAQNGFLEKGLELLHTMVESGLEVDVSSWNSIIAGCVRLGDAELSLEMLGEIISSGSMEPNSATFNTLLPVIPSIPSLSRLKELHGFSLRNGERVLADPVAIDRLSSAITAGYAFHGCMDYASALFGAVKLKANQLWNSMISGFLDSGQTHEAFTIFREMAFQRGHQGQALSTVSLTLVLPGCGQTAKGGLEIHAYAYRNGMESHLSVSNALMAMYARRRDRRSAEKVFRRTPEKDVVSWNTLIASYAMAHDFDESFKLFQQMLAEDVRPDEYTFSSVLNGCGSSSYLRQGMLVHGHLIKSGLCQSYLVVQNALTDAYGKCGSLEDARKVFEEIDFKDRISWNTIISCCGLGACPHEAFSLFHRMQEQGCKPNRITFIALLSACSHAGLLDEGFHYFEMMTSKHGIVPDVAHYACMVDNLGRAGQLDRAYQFIKDMPIEPDDCIWSALLSGCRIHGNTELAEVAAKHLIELDPQHSGYWVLLSNIYADASRWSDKSQVRTAMKEAGVKKSPGFSWIEVGGSELHRFFNADKLHKQCVDIYLALDGLTKQSKDEGYVPAVDSKFKFIDKDL
ncbi:pentatricopeptide repeat-containing protein At4g21065-like [Phoenix dactylifera]|uniref:Pentatricopeptide repeat-containing protein At4g21065-like n=1 Tax=Phoenix dactylifera TaxID=42345 RepID=A0A8B9AI17_PHODC|nr:pentatricopeptide repeat-containing protein At4g21065-like [Phoenix dactylifera]